MADIKDQTRSYLLDNFLMWAVAQDIQDDTSFMSSHILDSTGFVELVNFLQEQFGIRIKDEEMVPENLDSLNNIEQFVLGKLAVSKK